MDTGNYMANQMDDLISNGLKQKDELDEKMQSISNKDLIEKASEELSKLCKTGAKSFTMRVPVTENDTDMIFSELIRRFKAKTNEEELLKIAKELNYDKVSF